MKVLVLGSGSWGTALAVLLARNGHDVTLAGRDADEINEINERRENSRYLPGFALPGGIRAVMFADAPQGMDLDVVAVPSHAVEDVMAAISAPLIGLASKGLEPGTGRVLSAVVNERHPDAKVVAISGPNLAVELMRGIPTATVCASTDPVASERVAWALNCRVLRAYTSTDLVGVELAGALKNVLAISAGMSDGLGFGDNTKGALIARGLFEMTKLGLSLGARAETFFGIAGVGDLFATANSKLSRNYRVGLGMAQDTPLRAVLDEIGQVAEGVMTAESAAMLCRQRQIFAPIFEMTDSVLRSRMTAREGVTRLMERMPKSEGWDELDLQPHD